MPPGRDRACCTEFQNFSQAVVRIVATFLPLRTRPTMRGRRTVKRYCTGPMQLAQPDPTLHGRHRRTHPTAGKAGHWVAQTMLYQPQYCQQHNNHTRGRSETGLRAKQHPTRETSDIGKTRATRHGRPGPYWPRDNPRWADHWRMNTGEPTPRTGHAPVTTHPLHRTGRPPQPSEQDGKTTKTTSDYIGAGSTTGYRPNCCGTMTQQ